MKNLNAESKTQEAIFAMGCFWCGESEFRDHNNPNKMLPGIKSIRVGYAGGIKTNPNYENHEGYKEAVKITYDPSVISYDKLLDIFWHNIDPFDSSGQFCDKGFSYTSAIFFTNEQQKLSSEKSKASIQQIFKKEVFTEIIPFTTFYDAEEYHQNYKAKTPDHYEYYQCNSGRGKRLKEIWGKKHP